MDCAPANVHANVLNGSCPAGTWRDGLRPVRRRARGRSCGRECKGRQRRWRIGDPDRKPRQVSAADTLTNAR